MTSFEILLVVLVGVFTLAFFAIATASARLDRAFREELGRDEPARQEPARPRRVERSNPGAGVRDENDHGPERPAA